MAIDKYLSELIAQKEALANNLVSKGVEATTDEKFNTLVPKVLDITSGGSTGERYFLALENIKQGDLIAPFGMSCKIPKHNSSSMAITPKGTILAPYISQLYKYDVSNVADNATATGVSIGSCEYDSMIIQIDDYHALDITYGSSHKFRVITWDDEDNFTYPETYTTITSWITSEYQKYIHPKIINNKLFCTAWNNDSSTFYRQVYFFVYDLEANAMLCNDTGYSSSINVYSGSNLEVSHYAYDDVTNSVLILFKLRDKASSNGVYNFRNLFIKYDLNSNTFTKSEVIETNSSYDSRDINWAKTFFPFFKDGLLYGCYISRYTYPGINGDSCPYRLVNNLRHVVYLMSGFDFANFTNTSASNITLVESPELTAESNKNNYDYYFNKSYSYNYHLYKYGLDLTISANNTTCYPHPDISITYGTNSTQTIYRAGFIKHASITLTDYPLLTCSGGYYIADKDYAIGERIYF